MPNVTIVWVLYILKIICIVMYHQVSYLKHVFANSSFIEQR